MKNLELAALDDVSGGLRISSLGAMSNHFNRPSFGAFDPDPGVPPLLAPSLQAPFQAPVQAPLQAPITVPFGAQIGTPLGTIGTPLTGLLAPLGANTLVNLSPEARGFLNTTRGPIALNATTATIADALADRSQGAIVFRDNGDARISAEDFLHVRGVSDGVAARAVGGILDQLRAHPASGSLAARPLAAPAFNPMQLLSQMMPRGFGGAPQQRAPIGFSNGPIGYGSDRGDDVGSDYILRPNGNTVERILGDQGIGRAGAGVPSGATSPFAPGTVPLPTAAPLAKDYAVPYLFGTDGSIPSLFAKSVAQQPPPMTGTAGVANLFNTQGDIASLFAQSIPQQAPAMASTAGVANLFNTQGDIASLFAQGVPQQAQGLPSQGGIPYLDPNQSFFSTPGADVPLGTNGGAVSYLDGTLGANQDFFSTPGADVPLSNSPAPAFFGRDGGAVSYLEGTPGADVSAIYTQGGAAVANDGSQAVSYGDDFPEVQNGKGSVTDNLNDSSYIAQNDTPVTDEIVYDDEGEV